MALNDSFGNIQDLNEKSISLRSLGGSIVSRLKLKRIDGRAHNNWSLWLLIWPNAGKLTRTGLD